MTITTIIISINVAVSYLAFNNPKLQQRLIMSPVAVVHHGQWYRMITSGFIHANWLHLGFNMFTFYFFGDLVAQIFGAIKGDAGMIYFVVFYLLAIVISDIPTLVQNKDNPTYNSLGASGGVSAIVFSSILFFPTNPICLYGFICIPGFILGALYLIYSYTKGKQLTDNINHSAHLVGAVFGLVFSVLLEPRVLANFVTEIAHWRIF